jgi:hypothetical protein
MSTKLIEKLPNSPIESTSKHNLIKLSKLKFYLKLFQSILIKYKSILNNWLIDRYKLVLMR